jgi:hypothetical protein
MRLWSLHPSVLDRAGLVALWREGLLAQKVLLGRTKGYRFHPQLQRFRETRDPVGAISRYLWPVVAEARKRGYSFDSSKIARKRSRVSLTVTTGQLEFERQHLSRKLWRRDRDTLRRIGSATLPPHPMFRVVDGSLEPGEVGALASAAALRT